MPLTDTILNTGADAMAATVTHLSLHTADPAGTGANESTAARQPVTWGAAANGDFSLSAAVSFTGGTASGPCTHVGLWDALTTGTFLGSFPLTGDQTFNAAGEYTVDSLAINGSS